MCLDINTLNPLCYRCANKNHSLQGHPWSMECMGLILPRDGYFYLHLFSTIDWWLATKTVVPGTCRLVWSLFVKFQNCNVWTPHCVPIYIEIIQLKYGLIWTIFKGSSTMLQNFHVMQCKNPGPLPHYLCKISQTLQITSNITNNNC